MLIFLLSILPSFIYLFYKSKKSFQILQQNWYNDSNRYIKWIFNNIGKVFVSLDILIIFIFLFKNKILLTSIYIIFYFVMLLVYFYDKQKEQNKKPLVITARIKRLYITMYIIYILVIVLFLINFNINLLSTYYLLLGILIYFNWFIIALANFLNRPIEKKVFNKYKNQALKKLDSIPNLKKIGITGSYGKTSVKSMVNEVLKVKYNSYATEKSYNTMNGLMLAINNKLDKYTDIFIAEMGAFHKGEIKEKAEFIQPDYGILTVIGTAHLEDFKTRENIRDTKFELIEQLPESGVAILNMDDPYQVNYKLKNKCNVFWISIKNKDADIYASDIKMNKDGMSFLVSFKNGENNVKFTTKLLGIHNVSNILCAIAMGYILGLTMEELKLGVKNINSIEHRLELKKWHDIYLIDDAFNSNPEGAKMALDVLALMPGKKVIVTPGMIELGKDQYNYNKEFGKNIAKICDEVLLVGEIQTEAIMDGLIEANFDEDKVFITNDIKEAFKKFYKYPKNTYVLLENDLPDIFNE